MFHELIVHKLCQKFNVCHVINKHCSVKPRLLNIDTKASIESARIENRVSVLSGLCC